MNKLFLIICLSVITACDFSSRLNRDILAIQDYVKEQKYQKAVDKYLNVLERNPSKDLKVKIYFQLGNIFLLNLGDIEKARYYFEIISKETDDPLWLVKSREKLGEIYFSFLKKYSKSSLIYQSLVSFIPKLARYDFYNVRLAESLLNDSNFDEAKRILSKIKTDDKHEYYSHSYYLYGMLEFHQKNWKQAIHWWKEYLKRETVKNKIVEAKFLIANTYETLELLKQAYDIYYSILGEYPNSDVIQNRLESIYERRVARKR